MRRPTLSTFRLQSHFRYPHTAHPHNIVKHHQYKCIAQPLITPQTTVGANSVRPLLFTHMVCTNSNHAAPRNGLSRAPAPTIMLWFATPQNRCRSLRILRCAGGQKKRRRALHSDTALFLSLLCTSSFFILHRL